MTDENVKRATEAITVAECMDGKRMGLTVTACVVCKRPTFYTEPPHVGALLPPKTCGRLLCGESVQEPWATRVQT